MIKIIDKINSEQILNIYYTLEPNIIWYTYLPKGKQSGLQYKTDDDIWLGATGKSKGNELSYNNLNPFFKNTIFEKLIEKYNLKRARLMWMGPNSCYTFHKDNTPRIHIPLLTNEQCFLIFKEGLIEHLKIDNVYWVDTTKEHTAMNGSNFWRLHLVGAVNY
jgi:hypothetical protein